MKRQWIRSSVNRLLTLNLMMAGLAVGQGARAAPPDVKLDLHGYRPKSAWTVLAPVRPLAQWLGGRLAVETGNVVLRDGGTTVTIDHKRGQLVANGQLKAVTSPPLVLAGQLLVPLRPVAEAFGATAVYQPSEYSSSDRYSYQDGILLQLGNQRLWVPIYEHSPAVMTAMLAKLDEVIAGVYGRDWLLREQVPFDRYATVSIQPLDREKPKRYLLRRRGKGWLVLAAGENGHELSRQYLKQVMASGNPAGRREALNFLTSNPPPVARIISDIPQKTSQSALDTINDIYFKSFESVLRVGEANGAEARKLRREQFVFNAWFVRNYSRAGDQALAVALYHQGMAAWALGNLQGAKQAFRHILHTYGRTIFEHGPNGPITFRQALTRHRWVTVARRTPVRQYGARGTTPERLVLLKQVRVEPRSTLLVAYPASELDGDVQGEEYSFFQRYLKLWEGSVVVPRRNCISLAHFSLRNHER